MNEFFYGGFSVFGEFLFHAVGYDGVDGEAMMAHQSPQAIDGGGFHLEIGDAVLSVAEISESVYQMRIAESESEDTPLRTIEAGTGYGNALMEVVDKMFEQAGGGAVDVGRSDLGVDLRMGNEGL